MLLSMLEQSSGTECRHRAPRPLGAIELLDAKLVIRTQGLQAGSHAGGSFGRYRRNGHKAYVTPGKGRAPMSIVRPPGRTMRWRRSRSPLAMRVRACGAGVAVPASRHVDVKRHALERGLKMEILRDQARAPTGTQASGTRLTRGLAESSRVMGLSQWYLSSAPPLVRITMPLWNNFKG